MIAFCNFTASMPCYVDDKNLSKWCSSSSPEVIARQLQPNPPVLLALAPVKPIALALQRPPGPSFAAFDIGAMGFFWRETDGNCSKKTWGKKKDDVRRFGWPLIYVVAWEKCSIYDFLRDHHQLMDENSWSNL